MKKEISGLIVIIGLAAVFSFVLVSSAKAGTLTEASTTPADSYVTHGTSYSVSFKVASSIEIEAQIRLIFPSGFDVSGAANATSSIVASTTDENAIVASSTVSGTELTLWLADGSVAVANDTLHFEGIPNIVNPVNAGSYTLGIETRTQANELSDEASSTDFSILAAYAPRPVIDTSPPTSKITSPTAGATISAGKEYVITGIGSDVGGSTVNKVEISLDGGKNWFLAQSTASGGSYSWEYVWTNPTEGEYTIKVWATDAAGNVETPGAGVKVTVLAPEVPEEEVPEKPITEMTTQELQAKIVEIQQKIINLLQQIIQIIQQQIQELLAT